MTGGPQETGSQDEKTQDGNLVRKRPSRLWAFLNSAFGLWVLSALVIGLLSFGFTRWEDARAEEREKKEMIDTLDIEIAHRLRYVFELLRTEQIQPGRYYVTWYAIAGTKETVRAQTESGGFFTPVFEQFEGRNIVDLLWQLSVLQEGDALLLSALSAAGQLAVYYEKVELSDESSPTYYILPEPYRTEFHDVIWSRLALERWHADQYQIEPTPTPTMDSPGPTETVNDDAPSDGTSAEATPTPEIVSPVVPPLVPDVVPTFVVRISPDVLTDPNP